MRNVSRMEEYIVTNNCMDRFTYYYSFQLIVGLLHKLQMALQVYLVQVTL